MYMVISMPNRKSIAAGVSHFMMHLLGVLASIIRQGLALSNQKHHEIGLMIFMRRARKSKPP